MLLQLPSYSSNRHPIEAWQDWYSENKQYINHEIEQQAQHNRSEIRQQCPYEYTDSLNQRQVWTPLLTGRERQEFDSQLRVSTPNNPNALLTKSFMTQNRTTMMRLRPAPMADR